MNEIKLTHGPDKCCECVPILETDNKRYREALAKIENLDAEIDSPQGWNEWGEADCFHQARKIAAEALK